MPRSVPSHHGPAGVGARQAHGKIEGVVTARGSSGPRQNSPLDVSKACHAFPAGSPGLPETPAPCQHARANRARGRPSIAPGR